VGESRIGGHVFSERDDSRGAVAGQRALVGPKTTDFLPV
jgi:hypothetical protein